MSASIDISALTTEYTQNEQKYRVLAMLPSKTKEHVGIYPNAKGNVELTELEFASDIIQAWSSTFAPTAGAMELKPRTLETEDAKVDIQIVPAEFRRKWVAELMRNGWDNSDLPFEQYLMEKIAAKIAEELEKLVWQAQKPTNFFDGLKEIIADEITATNITPVVTGALTVSNAVEKLEDVYLSLPEAFRDREVKMFVSYAVKDLYDKNYRATYGALPYNQQFKKTFLDVSGEMCELVAVPGLVGSQRVVCTPGENIVIGLDLEGDAFKLNMEMDKRTLDIWADFNYGVQMALLGAVAVNDQV